MQSVTLLNEICDSSRLVCVFFPNILLDRGNSCQFLAKGRMTLWRERGLEVGRLEFSRRKAVAGEGGGDTQRQGETHSCVLVRMRKHKQVETGRDTVVFW